VGEATASHLSFYTALVEVTAAAIGGKKESKGPITEDLSNATPAHFKARVGQLLSL
jgi:hypothetical protein